MAQCQAAHGAGVRGVERLHIVGRQAERGEHGLHRGGGLHVVTRHVEPQQAVGGAGHTMACDGGRDDTLCLDGRSAVETCVQAVLRVDDAVEQAGRVAGGFPGRPRMPLDQPCCASLARRGPTPPRITREPGADDQGALLVRARRVRAGRRIATLEAGREPRQRDLAVAALAGRGPDLEADAGEAFAHVSGGGPGGEGRAGCGEPRERFEQSPVPGVGVVRRRQAIEEKGIDLGHAVPQAAAGVAQVQVQLHAGAVEGEAVQVRRERRPTVDQRRGEFGQR